MVDDGLEILVLLVDLRHDVAARQRRRVGVGRVVRRRRRGRLDVTAWEEYAGELSQQRVLLANTLRRTVDSEASYAKLVETYHGERQGLLDAHWKVQQALAASDARLQEAVDAERAQASATAAET